MNIANIFRDHQWKRTVIELGIGWMVLILGIHILVPAHSFDMLGMYRAASITEERKRSFMLSVGVGSCQTAPIKRDGARVFFLTARHCVQKNGKQRKSDIEIIGDHFTHDAEVVEVGEADWAILSTMTYSGDVFHVSKEGVNEGDKVRYFHSRLEGSFTGTITKDTSSIRNMVPYIKDTVGASLFVMGGHSGSLVLHDGEGIGVLAISMPNSMRVNGKMASYRAGIVLLEGLPEKYAKTSEGEH